MASRHHGCSLPISNTPIETAALPSSTTSEMGRPVANTFSGGICCARPIATAIRTALTSQLTAAAAANNGSTPTSTGPPGTPPANRKTDTPAVVAMIRTDALTMALIGGRRRARSARPIPSPAASTTQPPPTRASAMMRAASLQSEISRWLPNRSGTLIQ